MSYLFLPLWHVSGGQDTGDSHQTPAQDQECTLHDQLSAVGHIGPRQVASYERD